LRLIDSHCHLNMPDYSEDREAVLSRAREAGLGRLLVVGFDPESSREALRLAHAGASPEGPEILAAVGVHPHEAARFPDAAERELPELLAAGGAAAIGEVGLDYWYDHSPRSAQRELFARQRDLARREGLPLIVHLRGAADPSGGEAYADARAILREGGGEGLIHCFSGTVDQARAFLDLGFTLAFGGILTFPRSEELRRVAAYVPEDRILFETDAPYLAPHPYRGKRNEPAWVARVYEEAARIRGVALEALAERVEANFRALFGPPSGAADGSSPLASGHPAPGRVREEREESR